MKTENYDQLRRELRLAQLEIKVLREQLHQRSPEAQPATVPEDQPTLSAATESATAAVIIPMRSNESERSIPGNGHPRVLYVEDSEPNFRLIESILEDRPGTELIWAATGQQGIDIARAEAPQLVLLDLDLPDLHGSKVLEELRAQPETVGIPVVVISADATPSQIERMLTGGARNYLTKPFEIRRFLCVFDEVFAPA